MRMTEARSEGMVGRQRQMEKMATRKGAKPLARIAKAESRIRARAKHRARIKAQKAQSVNLLRASAPKPPPAEAIRRGVHKAVKAGEVPSGKDLVARHLAASEKAAKLKQPPPPAPRLKPTIKIKPFSAKGFGVAQALDIGLQYVIQKGREKQMKAKTPKGQRMRWEEAYRQGRAM